jgi:hypothetical protein
VAPRDLPLSRPSPRGKKNSRGAPRLRQIERGNLPLTQVRRDVIKRVRTVAGSGRVWRHQKLSREQTREPGSDNGQNAFRCERKQA